MLVYSITSRATFETAHALYDEIIKIKDSPNAADVTYSIFCCGLML